MTKKTLLFVLNNSDFFISHRLDIGIEALKQGWVVHVAAGEGSSKGIKRLESLGIKHHRLPLTRSGKNPIRELKTFYSLYKLLVQLKPQVLHLVTIKPVLYGGIAARFAKTNFIVFAISGLGRIFTSSKLSVRFIRWFVSVLYKLALAHKRKVIIFQNTDDLNTLKHIVNINDSNIQLIRGSGVDLKRFSYQAEHIKTPVVSIACRLLKDKGVGEFISAIKILNNRNVEANYWIVGDVDEGNPSSFRPHEVEQWRQLPNVTVKGYSDDIAKVYANSHIVCLPSYREGFPKSLIEAAAAGRPIITTDVPGCRDAVIPNETGLLVAIKDPEQLASALEKLILDSELRKHMGRKGRTFAELNFAIERVVEIHMDIYKTSL